MGEEPEKKTGEVLTRFVLSRQSTGREETMAENDSNSLIETTPVSPETPEDVAVLFSWANLRGAKYRDFSASRREYRAQMRAKALEVQREAELKQAREREAAAREADETVRVASRQSTADHAAAAVAEEAAIRADQERYEAQRHAHAAVLAERAAMEAEREAEDARLRAKEQTRRYAESEARRRAFAGPQPFDTVPGVINDPYHYAGHYGGQAAPEALSSGVRSAGFNRASGERRTAPSSANLPVERERRQIDRRELLRDEIHDTPSSANRDYARDGRYEIIRQRPESASGTQQSRPAPLEVSSVSSASMAKKNDYGDGRNDLDREEPLRRGSNRLLIPEPPRSGRHYVAHDPAASKDVVPPRHEDPERLTSSGVYNRVALQEMEAREREERRREEYATSRSSGFHRVARPEPTQQRPEFESASTHRARQIAEERARVVHEIDERQARELQALQFAQEQERRDHNVRMERISRLRADSDMRLRAASPVSPHDPAPLREERRREPEKRSEEPRGSEKRPEQEYESKFASYAGARSLSPSNNRQESRSDQPQRRYEQPATEQRPREQQVPAGRREVPEAPMRTLIPSPPVSQQPAPAAPQDSQSANDRAQNFDALRDAISRERVRPAEPSHRSSASRAAFGGSASRPAAQPPSQEGASSQPAWLRSGEGPSPALHDTLQHSRERVAARWFALKELVDPSDAKQVETAPEKELSVPAIAIVSLAGGVGKTSLVATIGRTLSAMGEKVLLADTAILDLMPFYFGARERRSNSVRTFSPPVGSTDAPIYTVNYEADQLGTDTAAQQRVLDELATASRGMHRVLLDLNAGSVWMARRIAKMSPAVLIPIAPDMNSVLGIQDMERMLHGMADAEGRAIQPYYVLNQFDASLPLHLDVREVLRGKLGDRLLPIVIRRTPAVPEALAEGMTVMDYAPTSPVVEDFTQLANWIRSLTAPAISGYRGMRWSEG